MLSATDPDKLSVLLPEPIRWYGVLRADPKNTLVTLKAGDQAGEAAFGSQVGWSNSQRSSMAASMSLNEASK
jgi:hypothetical protein